MAVQAKLNKSGFDDADPDTYFAFSELNETERHNLSAFQIVIVCQFVTTLNTAAEIVNGPLSAEVVEDIPQSVFNELAAACLEEWMPKVEDTLSPKAPTDA